VTSGATEALFAAITAVVQTGDEVIVIEPAFDCYVPAIKLSGGIPVFVKYRFPDFHIDWDDVKRAVTSKTRLMILNSPHNPTGAVLSSEDISALKRIARIVRIANSCKSIDTNDRRYYELNFKAPFLTRRWGFVF